MYRLVALRLEPLARTDLVAPVLVLFRGDLLLVADYNERADTHTIVPFRVTGAELNRQRELLNHNTGVRATAWCLAGDRLVVRDWKSKDMLLYTFE